MVDMLYLLHIVQMVKCRGTCIGWHVYLRYYILLFPIRLAYQIIILDLVLYFSGSLSGEFSGTFISLGGDAIAAIAIQYCNFGHPSLRLHQ